MMKKNGNTRTMSRKWIAGAVLLFAFFVMAGIHIWKDYRDTLMANQIDQLQITTQILSKNMESSIQEYEDDLDFFDGLELLDDVQSSEETRKIFQSYINTKEVFVEDLFWEKEDGTFITSVSGRQYHDPVKIAQMDDVRSLYQMKDEYTQQEKYMVVKKTIAEGKRICLVVDEEKYYNNIISDIKIGSNGYIVIKASDGKILMHPDNEQWGIDVIAGRKKMYPDLDFSSLEQMIEDQKKGVEGVSIYYSYWWTKKNLPRVKKISVYTPAKIGDDFLVISSVTDYSDFYQPIREGFTGLLLLFAGILAISMLAFFLAMKMFHQRKQIESENAYLKELNGLLEEVHQNEETIAHQQRLQIMGTMTGGIAHEFNNFLTPIMGYAELLLMEFPEDSDEYDSVMEIYEAAEKANDVVRQISTLSRKNVETVYKEVPVAQMLRRAVKMADSVCPAGIHMENHIDISDQSILGNATQLHQVILNICVNAVHAIGKKNEGRKNEDKIEGKIEISGKEMAYQEMDEELKKHLNDAWEHYICIEIRDNGCGMDSETLRQIFNPFFTTKKGGEGTGLGLALAEQIILSHKGYIYAESEKDIGTTFHILLPVMEKSESMELARTEEAQGIRIVAADDNVKVLKLLQKNFSKLGAEIQIFTNKKELLEHLKSKGADVLFVDESMEDIGGIDFCMSVQGKYPDMKKILMVSHITREIAEAKSRDIIDGYVEKPVSATMLLEAVRDAAAEG
ncbi:ATP-binding protein [Dorea sp.]